MQLQPVLMEDFEAMVGLCIEALRESLERLGRFDATRARARLAAGFIPEHMRHIQACGERVGFITLRPDDENSPSALKLDHLYLKVAAQGIGIGAWALDWAKTQALAVHHDITLSALKQSAANRFHLRHGFVVTGESDLDVDYRWHVRKGAAA